jgi:TonB family protein
LVHADPVRPSNLEILGLLPDKWHQVFSKVLAKNPPDRYETAADFVADLEHCQGAWFGALEGETAVISTPELAEALRDASQADSPPADVTQLSGEGDDETVLFESDGLSTSSDTPSPAPTDQTDDTLPGSLPLKDEEMETVLFTPSPGEQQAHTEGPAPATTKDEDVDTETVVLSETSARATTPPEPTSTATTAPGVAEDETVYAPPVEPPTETTKRLASKLGTKWTTKYLAIAAAGIFAAFVVVALAVLWMESRTEVPEFVPPTSPDAVAVPVAGTLSVVSEPEGATVWINGEERGVTPLEPQFIDFGVHSVRLEREGFKSHELAAELREDESDVRLEVTMEPLTTPPPPPPTRAFLVVRSTPEGAQVKLDGESIGTTPIQRTSTSPGERTLVLELEGFEPWELGLDLRAGDTETVTATLAPLAEDAPPEPEPPAVQVGELVERGPDVVDPKCVDCPAVSYPRAANERRLEGVVEVSFIVTENGAVQDIQIEESAGPAFDPFVVDVLKDWRFEPATKQGVPVKVRLTRRFRFQRGR